MIFVFLVHGVWKNNAAHTVPRNSQFKCQKRRTCCNWTPLKPALLLVDNYSLKGSILVLEYAMLLFSISWNYEADSSLQEIFSVIKNILNIRIVWLFLFFSFFDSDTLKKWIPFPQSCEFLRSFVQYICICIFKNSLQISVHACFFP